MYNIDSIVSVPGSYLEYNNKSSLSQASRNLKNELGICLYHFSGRTLLIESNVRSTHPNPD